MQHCRPEDAAQWFLCLWGTRQAGYSLPAWIQLFLDKELGSVIAQGPPPRVLEARVKLREVASRLPSVNAP